MHSGREKTQSEEPGTAHTMRLRAIHEALRYEFPAPDIEQMSREIERGYTSVDEVFEGLNVVHGPERSA